MFSSFRQSVDFRSKFRRCPGVTWHDSDRGVFGDCWFTALRHAAVWSVSLCSSLVVSVGVDTGPAAAAAENKLINRSICHLCDAA